MWWPIRLCILALVLLVSTSVAETLPVQPPGAGTLQDPVRIENLAHLRWLGETERPEDMVKTYLIVNDIDASESANWRNIPDGKGFLGVGGYYPVNDGLGTVRRLQFTGRILGNGKTISNLYIAPGRPYVGFVRVIDPGGRVENLTLDNLHIEGSNHLGGIAGINQGVIAASSAEVRFTTTVSQQRRIGGLVGQNLGIIVSSYATVTGIQAFPGTSLNHSAVGGLVGEQGPFASNAFIFSSYATGTVIGSNDVGGLVGIADDGGIEISFAAVEVRSGPSANPNTLGGFIGSDLGVGIVNGFWAEEFAGRNRDGSNDSTKIPKASMLGLNATSMALGFSSDWQISYGSQDRCTQGLPQLRVHAKKPSPYQESTLSGGDGSLGNPCVIDTWQDLNRVRDHRRASFVLNRTLDPTSSGHADVVGNPSAGFQPIGSSASPFTGTFNGQGHTIDGLKITRGSENRIGLFSVLGTGAIVESLALTNVNITGLNTVGALAGEIRSNVEVSSITITGSVSSAENQFGSAVGGLAGFNQGRISNATSSATVSGQAVNAGGLVGENSKGSITQSSASGNVTAQGFVGGLVGRSQSGLISQSFATGNVTATAAFTGNTISGQGMAGGLVADITLTDRIEQSASTGRVQGGLIGGLVGYARGGSPLLPQIRDSYSSATLAGSPSVFGALVGKLDNAVLERVYFVGQNSTGSTLTSLVGEATDATVTEAYWDEDTTDIVPNAQTIGVGKTTQQMISASTFSTWDLNTIWGLGSGNSISYPFLRALGLLEPAEVRLELVNVTPSKNATNVSLATTEVLLEFNIDATANGRVVGVEVLRNGVYVGTHTVSRRDLRSWAVGFEFRPGSTYKIILPKASFYATANSDVVLNNEQTITFTTVPFAQGDGTSSAPYQIEAPQDWVNLTRNSGLWDKHFVLTKDITFPIDPAQIIQLSPIGPFSGTLDGQGHFISNAVVEDVTSVDVGLFKSITSTGVVKNLHLVNAKVTGTQTTGIMAGLNVGTLENVSAQGSATSTGNQVGGLVGVNRGLIKRSFANAKITGANVLGGLVGTHKTNPDDTAAKLENVYANSALVGRSDLTVAGGLVGQIEGVGNLVENAYSVSGIAPTPSVTTHIGGLVGQDMGTSTSITSSYYISTWPGGNSAGGTSKTNAELKAQATFSNWDFTANSGIWTIVNGTDIDGSTPIESYPYLQGLPYDAIEGATIRMPIPGLGEKKYADGTGTSSDPFIIRNWRHLNNIRNETAASPYFRLEADLDQKTVGYSEYASAEANSSAGWLPLPSIAGLNFNGNGKAIRDLVIDRPATSKVGLFSEIATDATISDAVVHAIDVSGKDRVGILAGVNLGTVELSATHGVSKSNIEQTNTNAIDAFNGGLVGDNAGTITESFSTARVLGLKDGLTLGGLVGLNRGSITDCYATGSVNGPGGIGGLVGQNGVNFADGSSISRSYAVGLVFDGQNSTGVAGLVGRDITDAGSQTASDIAPDSFWDMQTTSQADPGDDPQVVGTFPSPGVGKTTAQMKSITTYTTDLGGSAWDFTTVWDIINITQGDDTIVSYPVLRNNRQTPEPGRDYLEDFEPTNPGLGTVDNPYRITTWRHLANIARHPNAVFSLEQDLVASESDPDFVAFASITANDGLGWLPIIGQNASGENVAFTGTLKGNNRSISGLVINRPDEDNIGLFAELGDGARIENITLEGLVSGRSNVGTVAGLSGQATLENVTVTNSSIQAGAIDTVDGSTVDVNALKTSNVGGLLGKMTSGGTLTSVTADNVSINSQGARVGGLVGHLEQGSITQSQATLRVSAPGGVGGLVGRLSNSAAASAIVSQSWSTLNLTHGNCQTLSPAFGNEEGSGGLVGTARSQGAVIEQSHTTLSVTLGDGCEHVGGILGFSYNGKIEDSYALGDITAGDQTRHVATLLGNKENFDTQIINSYGAVSISTGTGSQYIGGLLGSQTGLSATNTFTNAPSIQSSFYNQGLPGNETDDCDTGFNNAFLCGESKTTLQLKDPATFANWSLTGASPIWQMASGNFVSYPFLTSPAQDPAPGLEGAPMVLEFDTTLGDGTTVSLPLDAKVNVRIDWGDGLEDVVTSAGFAEHTYASEGTYTVKIYGELTHYGRRNGNTITFPNAEKLTTVTSFGNLGLRSLGFAFKDAIHLTDVPTTLPSSVTRLIGTFMGASTFNDPDIVNWDVSQVLDMSRLFQEAALFNQPIGTWNTPNVRQLAWAFLDAVAFDQPLSGWDVSNVTSFLGTFARATQFNQDLNTWQLSSARNLSGMFQGATKFNGNISNWQPSSVINMSNMFVRALSFNQPIGSWDVQAVTNFQNMFRGASAFNQPLNTWQPSQGENFRSMFQDAIAFNQPLNNWTVGNATNMRDMFYGASSFNQSLADWDFSNVTDLTDVLLDSGLTTAHYDALLQSLADQTLRPNVTMGVGDVRYNEGAPATARADLIANDGWTIEDGGVIPTFSGGTGAITTPHKISSLADLKTLSEDPNSWNLNFELTQSIDASDTANWNNGEGFGPIGNSVVPFSGQFEGNGHTIRGLFINRPNQSQVGLFGHVAGMVDSLNLINVDITGETEVGGLAGFNEGMILDVAVSGQIKGSVAIAGLIGTNGPLGHVSSVASHADVIGSNTIGGVIGANRGTLQDAYATGTLSSDRTVGGLVGSFTESRSVIERGYSATTMTTAGLENQTPGGIAGSVGTQDPNAVGGQIRHSYFVGSFSPEGSKLPSFNNYSIDANTMAQQDLRAITGPIGTDADWAINSPSGEWAMLSVDQIQANGKFYRAYPYLKIFNYDEPGTSPAVLPLPGLIEMPMPPQIDRDNTRVNGGTLTLTFSVPQDSVDATVTGVEYSLDNGQTWQTASQALSPISVTGLSDNQAYLVRVRTQTNQGVGPMSQPYRVITGGTIFQDRFQQIPAPEAQ